MKKCDVGVVVGRFQVPELHAAHRKIIEMVIAESRNPLVFIGIAPALGTKEDPLDFTSRAQMIREAYPQVQVHMLQDRPTNEEWSKNLDNSIRAIFPMGEVVLYGGRDSFIKSYKGGFKTFKIPTLGEDNGTAIRKDAGKTIVNSADFRRGIIYLSQNQYPKVYPTVDIAVVNDKKEVLLGRKGPKELLVFPGGFVDPTDKSLEDAAARELSEEVGINLETTDYFYVGSYIISDWRYRKDERIMTSFFTTRVQWGRPENSAELEDVQYVKLSSANRDLVAPGHHVLFDALMKHYKIPVTKTKDIRMEDEVRD